ncbi:MAG: replication-associated recombination protein A [Immundisolibacterales bacterium]|nr:replication-associated recombination protein A [Immundisolibacterales bacterium]
MNAEQAPLADRFRPRALSEFAGQLHLVGEGKPLRAALEGGRIHSMVLWGPPGSGKTTLARLAAKTTEADFIGISAVLAGVKDIRAAVDAARSNREVGRPTVLFVDEVHRFNKAQQDAFLPHVEDGTIVFIGATTENPSFEVNSALLSRARVYVLNPVESSAIEQVLERALHDRERGLGRHGFVMDSADRDRVVEAADGDVRRALNALELTAELAMQAGEKRLESEFVSEALTGGTYRRFDKGGDAFYDLISAVHKSIRGSNPDAALYWTGRIFDGGGDPLYVARRLVRVASEDIGNADPRALRIALDAWEAYQRLGSPEGDLAIAQAAVYLACAAKSDAVYTGFGTAMGDVRRHGSLPVPLHLRNAPTSLMRDLGYGRSYRHAHDEAEGYAAGETYLPDRLAGRRYYAPVARGLEIRISEKLARLRELDRAAKEFSRKENPDA